jgi:HPt (histidine-containing phosphotransfer) domain-containing protein
MDGQLHSVNLDYLDDISGGDRNFKKELIVIFLKQIPDFIRNLHRFLIDDETENLAKEAHTAKSSVLIFMMEETGKNLKKIQLLAENNQKEEIFPLILDVQNDLEKASEELNIHLNELDLVKK